MSFSVSRNNSCRSFSAMALSLGLPSTTLYRRETFLLAFVGAPNVAEAPRLHQIDLLVEPRAVHRHQRVVADIRRTAQRILHEEDAKAEVDGVQHGRQHADVGFGAGHDDGADLAS